MPEEFICALCGRAPGELLDHVLAAGRPGSPDFWREDNHVSLCAECHRTKSAVCDGAMGNAPGAKAKEILAKLVPEAKRRWEAIQRAQEGDRA